jgi:hypothetical protein
MGGAVKFARMRPVAVCGLTYSYRSTSFGPPPKENFLLHIRHVLEDDELGV